LAIVCGTRIMLAKLTRQIARTYPACCFVNTLMRLELCLPLSASAFSVDQCFQLAWRVRTRTVWPKTAGETKVMAKTVVVGAR
jgi:hypothetical protein